MSDKVEERVTKKSFMTRVWPSCWAKKIYYFVKKLF